MQLTQQQMQQMQQMQLMQQQMQQQQQQQQLMQQQIMANHPLMMAPIMPPQVTKRAKLKPREKPAAAPSAASAAPRQPTLKAEAEHLRQRGLAAADSGAFGATLSEANEQVHRLNTLVTTLRRRVARLQSEHRRLRHARSGAADVEPEDAEEERSETSEGNSSTTNSSAAASGSSRDEASAAAAAAALQLQVTTVRDAETQVARLHKQAAELYQAVVKLQGTNRRLRRKIERKQDHSLGVSQLGQQNKRQKRWREQSRQHASGGATKGLQPEGLSEADLERTISASISAEAAAEGADALSAEGGTASTSELSITPPLSPPCSPPAWDAPRIHAATRAKGTKQEQKERIAAAAAALPLTLRAERIAEESEAAPPFSVGAMGGAVGCLVLVVLLYRAATPGFPLLDHLRHSHPGLGVDADVASSSSSSSAAELPELQQQVASVVAVPLVGMLLGSACFPEALPAYALPFMQGAAVAMAIARCHATALALVGITSPVSAGTLVRMAALLLSALGGIVRAALLVGVERCYFWATSRALAALNGCLLLAAVVASLCLDPPSSTGPSYTKLTPEAGLVAAGCLLAMALVFTPTNRRRLALCACGALALAPLDEAAAAKAAAAKAAAKAAATSKPFAVFTRPSMTAVLPSRKAAAAF